jgi:hypothetical protein
MPWASLCLEEDQQVHGKQIPGLALEQVCMLLKKKDLWPVPGIKLYKVVQI